MDDEIILSRNELRILSVNLYNVVK